MFRNLLILPMALALPLVAANVSLTITPTNYAGADWSFATLDNSFNGGAPGFGSSSVEHRAGATKAEIIFGFGYLHGATDPADRTPYTLNTITDLSFWTDTVTAGSDWFLNIYTAPQAGDANFYHNRFLGVQVNPGPSGQWNQYDSQGVSPTLEFLDTTGQSASAAFTGSLVTWDSIRQSAGSQTLLYLSLGTASGAPGFAGSVDGLHVGFGADSADVNFEATPEPATFGLIGLSLAGLAYYRRKSA